MWVIGVPADPIENRGERYFNGYCAPGFHGNTTIFIEDAMFYSTKEGAERDIAKLAPHAPGSWEALERDV